MLRIGPISLDVPLAQAALAGYSDAAMRLISRQHGAAYAVQEAVLDRLVTQSGRLRRRFLQVPHEDHPIGGQLMGSTPAEFAEAAALMAEAGFDVIDLNFACPVRKVLGRQRGGYLLSDPPAAIAIVKAVRAALPRQTPLTLKLRQGTDRSADSERKFLAIFDAALAEGVAAITVHGRTVQQRYRGPSDWAFLARVKRHAGDAVVLGSGDLFTPEDILRMLEQTAVDGVMVARGSVGNPWIFSEARALLAGQDLPEPPGIPEQGRVIRSHFDLAVSMHGPRRGPRIMRKFGMKYAERHPQFEQVRDAFRCACGCDGWLAVLDEWYDPARAWPPGLRKTAPGHLIAAGATP